MMAEISISFAGQSLAISFPAAAASIIDFTFRGFSTPEKPAQPRIKVLYDAKTQLFSVISDNALIGENLPPADLSLLLLRRCSYSLTSAVSKGLLLQGAAVQRDNRAVLMPGGMGIGKSLLTSWLLSHGYAYLSDELAYFPHENKQFSGLNTPIHLQKEGRNIFEGFSPFLPLSDNCLQNDQHLLFAAELITEEPPVSTGELALLLFIEHSNTPLPDIEALSPAVAAKQLLTALPPTHNNPVDNFRRLAALTRKTPALLVRYSTLQTLETFLLPVLDCMLHTPCPTGSFQEWFHLFRNIYRPLLAGHKEKKEADQVKTFPVPAATRKGTKRKLTIGMATYDDFDGVYFTVQALQMYHAEIIDKCEILVIDNHPDGPCSGHLKHLDQSIHGYRYIPLQGVQGTAVRDHIFAHAASDHVLCLDCHVLLIPGAIKKLLDYFENNLDRGNLLQGPMLRDNLQSYSTHLSPVWQEGMFGKWDTDPRGKDADAAPFEIPMQGLGLFACRKDAWPGFNPRFRGFGGEEGYIHEKFRQKGRKTLCLPFLRWLHRFARPLGVPYSLNWSDRIWNYQIGRSELHLPTEDMEKHFCDYLGIDTALPLLEQSRQEVASPFFFFDAIYCITLSTESSRWDRMQLRFQALGIHRRIRVFHAISTPENHHVGCALSHRTIIAAAKREKLKNVLVFEDDALFLDSTLPHLEKSIAELKKQSWDLFYLGGHRWGKTFAKVDGCSSLLIARGITCTHALAYNSTVYDKILNDIPDKIEETSQWTRKHRGIDQYLRSFSLSLLTSPAVASQQELLPQEEEQYRNRFTLTAAPSKRTNRRVRDTALFKRTTVKQSSNLPPYARKDAMGNFFFLCPRKHFMFLSISKNGCTSLKNLIFLEEYGRTHKSSPGRGIHAVWGFKEKPGRVINRADKESLRRYSDYIRFVVYRDPVERFLSTYYNKVLYPPYPHIFYTTHNLTGISLDAFIDKAAEILTIPDPLLIDEHLRKQSDYFTPEDVDHIVPLPALEHFVTHVLGCNSLPHDNRVRQKKVPPTEKQIETIQKLYAADYNIIPTYKIVD